MPNLTTLGERIAAVRKQLNLTQHQFAATIGYSRATLAGVETDKDEPGIRFLIKVADLGAVSIDWLLGRIVPFSGPFIGNGVDAASQIAFLRLLNVIPPGKRGDFVTLLERLDPDDFLAFFEDRRPTKRRKTGRPVKAKTRS